MKLYETFLFEIYYFKKELFSYYTKFGNKINTSLSRNDIILKAVKRKR